MKTLNKVLISTLMMFAVFTSTIAKCNVSEDDSVIPDSHSSLAEGVLLGDLTKLDPTNCVNCLNNFIHATLQIELNIEKTICDI